MKQIAYCGIDTVEVATPDTNEYTLKNDVMPHLNGWKTNDRGDDVNNFSGIRVVIKSTPWRPATCIFSQEVSRYNGTLSNAGQLFSYALRAFRNDVEAAISQSRCSYLSYAPDALLRRSDVYFDIPNVPTLSDLRRRISLGRRKKYAAFFYDGTMWEYHIKRTPRWAIYYHGDHVTIPIEKVPICLRDEAAFRAALLGGELTAYIKHEDSRRYEELAIYRKHAPEYGSCVLIRHEVKYRHLPNLRAAFVLEKTADVHFSALLNPFSRRRLMTAALDFVEPLYGSRLQRRTLERLIFISCFANRPVIQRKPRCYSRAYNNGQNVSSEAVPLTQERGPPEANHCLSSE